MVRGDDDAYFGADQRMDEAMATLDEERRKISEMTTAQAEQRTTVQGKGRAFSMTFDGRGDLVDMAFQGTKFRSMAPAELSSSIVATFQQGRLEAIEKMAASMQTPSLAGVDLVGMATGKADPEKVVEALLAPLLEGVPGTNRRPGGPRA
jgi:hypothetical protein